MKPQAPTTRRAFAMLLVLISLAIATILATAYLASRDNSAMIGQNVAAGTSARWAALTALNAGIATLETETDWRANHTAGVVFANASLAGASVDLKFMDLATGSPPTATTTDIEITATARLNGMEETVVAHAHVPLLEKRPDLDLSEFAVFARSKVKVKDTSLIGRWSKSPKGRLGKSIAIGTASKSAGSIELADYGVAVDGVVYRVAGASTILVSNSGPRSVQTVDLPDDILVPQAPSPGVLRPLALVSALWSNFNRNNGAAFTITNNRDIKSSTLTTNAVVTIRGPVTVTVAEGLTINTGAKLVIQGDVKLVVFGKFDMGDNASIDLEPGATLELYAGDDVTLDTASINEVGAGTVRDTSGEADWMDPTRFRLYEVDSASKNWTFTDGSTIKGLIYAPNKKIKFDKSSAIYGAVVGDEVELASGAAVYYDHTLDIGTGYTQLASPVYGNDGKIKSLIKTTVNTLDRTVLAVLDLLLGVGNGSGQATVGASDPTPRTVKVEYEIVNFANDVPNWESKATMIAVED